MRPRDGSAFLVAISLTPFTKMKIIGACLLAGLGLALLSAATARAEVTDFALEDQNTTSPRRGELVSPRDYRHQVTAWYFGAAT